MREQIESEDVSIPKQIEDLTNINRIEEALSIIEELEEPQEKFKRLIALAGEAYWGFDRTDQGPYKGSKDVKHILDLAGKALAQINTDSSNFDNQIFLITAQCQFDEPNTAIKELDNIVVSVEHLDNPAAKINYLIAINNIYRVYGFQKKAADVLQKAKYICSTEMSDEQEKNSLMEQLSKLQ